MGVGVSSQPAHVTVHYPPLVSIRMDPPTPVTETDHRSVPTSCFYQ
jgi:hypothetical protein